MWASKLLMVASINLTLAMSISTLFYCYDFPVLGHNGMKIKLHTSSSKLEGIDKMEGKWETRGEKKLVCKSFIKLSFRSWSLSDMPCISKFLKLRFSNRRILRAMTSPQECFIFAFSCWSFHPSIYPHIRGQLNDYLISNATHLQCVHLCLSVTTE